MLVEGPEREQKTGEEGFTCFPILYMDFSKNIKQCFGELENTHCGPEWARGTITAKDSNI